jgi:hypothetical protein
MYMKFWKVYGAEGHRQRESFGKSESFDTWDNVKIIVLREDYTGTNEFVFLGVVLDAPDRKRAEQNLYAQISDGVFENSRVGDVEEYLETVI